MYLCMFHQLFVWFFLLSMSLIHFLYTDRYTVPCACEQQVGESYWVPADPSRSPCTWWWLWSVCHGHRDGRFSFSYKHINWSHFLSPEIGDNFNKVNKLLEFKYPVIHLHKKIMTWYSKLGYSEVLGSHEITSLYP